MFREISVLLFILLVIKFILGSCLVKNMRPKGLFRYRGSGGVPRTFCKIEAFLVRRFLDFEPMNLKGLGHAILGNFVILLIMSSKRQIGRPRVFHLQNHGHITTENDFPAE